MSEPTPSQLATDANVAFRQKLILIGIAFAAMFLLLIVAIGGAYFVFSASGGGSDRPYVLAADEASETSGRDWLRAMADAHSMAAVAARRGDIKTRADLAEYLDQQESRDRAFGPYNRVMESQLPQDFAGQGESVASVLEECAAGFQEAAE